MAFFSKYDWKIQYVGHKKWGIITLTGTKVLDFAWHPKFSIFQIMQHFFGINIIERDDY